METVKQYKSETVIFFVATGLVGLIAELSASEEFRASLGSNATWIIMAMSVVGYLLRRFTTKPLETVVMPRPKPKPLDILDEAQRKDAEENGLV